MLSPLPWNLLVDEILEKTEREVCKVVGYVNDPMIIVRIPFLNSPMKITLGIKKKIGDLVCKD